MKKFKNSDFYWKAFEVVQPWDYYLRAGVRDCADEMMHKWDMAKTALKFITGKTYGLRRDDSTFAFINEANYNDVLFRKNMKYIPAWREPDGTRSKLSHTGIVAGNRIQRLSMPL